MAQAMDFDAPQPTEADLAPQACASCRKQKRRCDKSLPSCGLCNRIGRLCDYSPDTTTAQAPSPEDFAALRQQVAELQQLLRPVHLENGSSVSGSNGSTHSNGSSTDILKPLSSNGYSPGNPLSNVTSPSWPGPSSFPSLFFLDSNAFEYERFQIQTPHVKVPPGALTALGNSAELRAMIEHYFGTVHTYFPIISKIRLYQHLANPLHEPGADIALLFLAMKLICSEIPEGMPPQTQLYQDVKSFYHYVEAQNGFSVQMIQALLLIALYEMGHSIYPAAYLSIGNAARIGHAAGLHARKAPHMLPRCNTWTEQEERRRLWWGVVILDRFINIGHRGKPFATNDPSLDTHLPTDDASWDRGQMLVATPLALSASSTTHAAPFARTCQAAHLLGKVLRHIDDQQLSIDYRFTDAIQLHRTMRALVDVLIHEAKTEDDPKPALCTSVAMMYSGLLTLYDSYSCTEKAVEYGDENQLQVQKESIDGLSEISEHVFQLAGRVREIVNNGDIETLSPMIIDSLYQGAANYAWYVRESSHPTCGKRLQELKDLLLTLERRWRVAGEYYRIIEATEFHLSAAIN